MGQKKAEFGGLTGAFGDAPAGGRPAVSRTLAVGLMSFTVSVAYGHVAVAFMDGLVVVVARLRLLCVRILEKQQGKNKKFYHHCLPRYLYGLA